jgi:phage gp46-like protein
MYTIQTITQANAQLVQQYAVSALNWMVQSGQATSVSASATVSPYAPYRYDLTVAVAQSNGVITQYQFAQNVSAGTMTFVYVGQS